MKQNEQKKTLNEEGLHNLKVVGRFGLKKDHSLMFKLFNNSFHFIINLVRSLTNQSYTSFNPMTRRMFRP